MKEKGNPHVFLTEDFDFQVIMGLSSFLLNQTVSVTSNKGLIREKFHFIRFSFTPKKLRFSSPHKAIEFPSTRNFKLGVNNLNKGQISFCPIYSEKVSIPICLCPKITIFKSS